MNLALWIIAATLATVFLAGGAAKVIMSRQRFRALGQFGGRDVTGWTEDFSPEAFTTIGGLEVLAAIVLVLPPAVGIAPVLAPLAAIGLVLVMIGAAVVHLRRHEFGPVAGNLVYLALAAFVAWGRLGPAPFVG